MVDELILVKNSWARERLKIDRYINPAVELHRALLLPGRPTEQRGERERETG